MRERLDKIDLEIIRLLQTDGRMASSEIAKATGVPEATIRYRLKKLIDRKFIQIVAAANPIKLGFGIAASISIDADTKQVEAVIRDLEEIELIAYIAQMTDLPNVILEAYIESIHELHDILSQIEKIDGINSIKTSFIRKIARERFDFGTPRHMTDSNDEISQDRNTK